ncbi:MAG: hypothetical protein M3R15_34965 [Acidobacteriota bacterium]|nr:hypothetical protein [Acidobacteriota bacterium]
MRYWLLACDEVVLEAVAIGIAGAVAVGVAGTAAGVGMLTVGCCAIATLDANNSIINTQELRMLTMLR